MVFDKKIEKMKMVIMYKIYILIICCICISSNCLSSEFHYKLDIDSLKNDLKKYKNNDTIKVNKLLILANELKYFKVRESLEYSNQAVLLSDRKSVV
jgi:hypothetical protein